jgi:hypothetical protein
MFPFDDKFHPIIPPLCDMVKCHVYYERTGRHVKIQILGYGSRISRYALNKECGYRSWYRINEKVNEREYDIRTINK